MQYLLPLLIALFFVAGCVEEKPECPDDEETACTCDDGSEGEFVCSDGVGSCICDGDENDGNDEEE